MNARKKFSRGMVLLYAVTVFAVIASIGLTILDSGEYFVSNTRLDYHTQVAQQAALSGIAYGEATIQQALNLAATATFPGVRSTNRFVPLPAWAGKLVSGAPYAYDPLLGAKPAGGVVADPTTFPPPANLTAWTTTFTVETRGGQETERARFRIELRECSRPQTMPAPYSPPAPTAIPVNNPGCGGFLYDENLLRIGHFWNGSSPLKPPINQGQAFGLLTGVSDGMFMFTMRVEGEALVPNPATQLFDGGEQVAARVVAKETFTFRQDSPIRLNAQAFWYQDLQRGY